jgi:hypothetical protein
MGVVQFNRKQWSGPLGFPRSAMGVLPPQPSSHTNVACRPVIPSRRCEKYLSAAA